MQLDTPFIQLPLHFDAKRMLEEVAAIPESDWQPHPQAFAGNAALILVAVNGDHRNQDLSGAMQPTPLLRKLPYIQQIFASLKIPIGRTRLMRLDGNSDASLHMDSNYYWQERVRIHIPIQTNPDVHFHCGDAHLNMAEGECWIFNTWQMHKVENPRDDQRIHLVIDTVGSSYFWNLVEQGNRPFAARQSMSLQPLSLPFIEGATSDIPFERVNLPVIMSPWEVNAVIQRLLCDVQPGQNLAPITATLKAFGQNWHAEWACHGCNLPARSAYQALLDTLAAELAQQANEITLNNGMMLDAMLIQQIILVAINKQYNSDLAPDKVNALSSHTAMSSVATQQDIASTLISAAALSRRFEQPTFIIAAPRSGSSFLFETLVNSPSVFTVGGESHAQFESIAALSPAHRSWHSNRLTANDTTEAIAEALYQNFLHSLQTREGQPISQLLSDNQGFRLLEKTPKNALRIPFLKALFPEARFVYLIRDAKENISSIMEAWRSERFVTYPQLPDWNEDCSGKWSLLLTPQWQQLKNAPLEQVAATQWAETHRTVIEDLQQLDQSDWMLLSYADLITDTETEVNKICDFANIEWDKPWDQALPNSRHTLTAPAVDKWKKNAQEIAATEAIYLPVEQALQALLSKPEDISVINNTLQQAANQGAASAPMEENKIMSEEIAPAENNDDTSATEAVDFSSSYTNTLASLLQELDCSLLVSTYQAGKLIVVREDQGSVNTHFRVYDRPMGIAVKDNKLAIGTHHHIRNYKNMPDVAPKIEPKGKHDACYVPTGTHVTGNIDIHEMEFGADDRLWYINTRFSCLCTQHDDYSFVPEWKPPFITHYSPDDRCHLNGLAMRDGQPRYVSALGTTNEGGTWRENKVNGGIIMDLKDDSVVIEGLSMPHSPRWYGNNLWLLESGKGTVNMWKADEKRLLTVAELPGFTRGIDFIGEIAFVGLSQVRETSLFSGLEITEKYSAEERSCGVWVINLRSGEVLGFLKFEGSVQEIFAVKVVPNSRFPEILEEGDELASTSYALPDAALKFVAKD